jgi:porin
MINTRVGSTATSIVWIIAFGLSCACPTFAAEEAKGILPVPQYGADISSRNYLTGDWGGKRTEWADKGLQFDVDWVQWGEAVVDGGRSSRSEFGGNFTYNLKVDLMRAGVLPGALLQVRAESRYGSSANPNTAQIVPPNTAALSPTNYSDPDAGYDIALTNLSYVQFLSEQVGVLLGKLDLYADGDLNEFAGGRGRTQFSHWSLNYGTPLLFVPASTIGAGVLFLPNKNLTITSLLLSGTECTQSNCFDDLDEKGGISATTATYQYRLGSLPGGVNGSFLYFFDKDFTNIASIAPVPTEGLVGSTETESWIVGGSLWQYLSVKGTHEGPLDLTNRQADLQGWGIFGRLFFADDKTNPWKTSVAAGVGGRGVIPTRPNDMFGIGYFYNGRSVGLFTRGLDADDHTQGVEGFYNLAITPAARFSTNVQYLPSVGSRIDDSVLLTGRLQVVF